MTSGSRNPAEKAKPSFVLTLSLAAVALLAAILYWPTLRLPLIYDDLLHIRIVGGLDFLTVWLPTEAFGFYRPLTFLPLLIIENIFGHYPSWLLHGLNVFQHALNVFLLGALSWRLWSRIHWAVASGLLLAVFPFSYQAISVYGHNVHPTTAGILLLALHTYLSAIRATRRRWAWWGLTAGLFVLGLMSHESAILFGFFAALVQWNDKGQLPTIRNRDFKEWLKRMIGQPWFIFLFAGFVYFVGYQFLPLSRAPQAAFADSSLWFKFLYLIQAAAFPLSWFASLLPPSAGISNVVVLLAFSLAIGLTIWSNRNLENRLPLLMGWSWWLLASIVVAVPLSASYLLHGPRLMYLGSVGLALLWPVLLEPIFQLPKAGRLLWVGAILAIVLINWTFVRDRLDSYARLTDPVAVVENVITDQDSDQGILFVNLPNWLAPERNTYPIGVELVAMMGDYLFIEELINENLLTERPAQAIRFPDLLANQAYTYGIHEQSEGPLLFTDWVPEGSHIFIVSYSDEGPKTRYAGQFIPRDLEHSPIATLGPYEIISSEAEYCEGRVTLTTILSLAEPDKALEKIAPTTSLFVQALDSNGQLIGQADGPPLGLGYDYVKQSLGWQLEDRREFSISDAMVNTVLLGAYDYVTGERYLAQDVELMPLPDNAYSITPKECEMER
jgi:hypothetical protein